MKTKTELFDVVVCGGGLAGLCAAIASARHGASTALVQDRPVFGGNSSSEVRVTPHGAAAFHAYARETGIISELLIEERARNHEVIFENGWTNSVWDLTMYDLAMQTPNLKIFVNTTVFDVQKNNRRELASVTGRVGNAETNIIFQAKTFIDCTGDGTVAALAGCEWRMGSEGRDEFDEPHAPEQASDATMGNSIHFKTRDVGRPVPFTPPDWAIHYEDASYFYEQGRNPKDVRGGFWWLEIGVPWNTIYESEDIRHELTRHALGVWDWMKNKDPLMKDKAANYALDWIGQVPGKRESRRIMGQYLMTEHDPQNRTVFPDEIGFGGWFLDLHTPGGLLAPTSEPTSAEEYNPSSAYSTKSYVGPYGIPLRILISKDIDNLMMAGRNVSTTHAALGTVRVQGTTALLGQAAGTTAAIALKKEIPLPQAPQKVIFDVQQNLLRDGCFLLNTTNQDPADLARYAAVKASSEALTCGVGPHSTVDYAGMKYWTDQRQGPSANLLKQRVGQWIALGTDHLAQIAVCLGNHSDQVQPIQAVLNRVDHIWDYRSEPYPPLAAALLSVEPGALQWITWDLDLTGLKPGGYLRLDLLPNPNIEWYVAGAFEPGQLAAFEIAPGKMRRYSHGVSMSFTVSPHQPCYGPANILSGVTRPYRATNLWRSDPRQPLPQWLELAWEHPQQIGQLEITFPGHLLREYHAYPPFYRDPQCASDYVISALQDGKWETLLEVSGNYQRQRIHKLDKPVTTDRLRITIRATNGDLSAAIYEVRCYA